MIKLIMCLKNFNIYLLLNILIMLNLNKCKCQNISVLLYFIINFFLMCYSKTDCIKLMIIIKIIKIIFFLYCSSY